MLGEAGLDCPVGVSVVETSEMMVEMVLETITDPSPVVPGVVSGLVAVDSLVVDRVWWLSLEEVGEKLLILPEVDVSGGAFPEVVWLLLVDDKAGTVPPKVVSITSEANVLVCGSPVVAVP